MSQLLVSLLLLVSLVSCGKQRDEETFCDMVCEINEFTLPVRADGELPDEALSFNTNLRLVNFSATQTRKIEDAARIIREIIATKAFRNAVLNYQVNGVKSFANNNGLTNQQIYDRILIASETLYPLKNNTLDAEIELYYENSNTIGYTYASVDRIWMNTRYFDSYTSAQVAANLMHEWLHKLGFTHDFASTSMRPHSVPYAVGYMIRDLYSRR